MFTRDFSENLETLQVVSDNKKCRTILTDGYILYAYPTLEECENAVIGTRILDSFGIPVQEVELGMYQGGHVVAAKEYIKDSEIYVSLKSLLYPVGEPSDDLLDITKRIGELKYDSKEDILSWFWSVFVADGLLGYTGRTLDNMGVLYDSDTRTIRVSPIIGGNKGFSFHEDVSYMESMIDIPSNIVIHEYHGCNLTKYTLDGRTAWFWTLARDCDIEAFRKSVNNYVESVDLDKIYSIIDSVEGLIPVKNKLAKACLYGTYHLLCDHSWYC